MINRELWLIFSSQDYNNANHKGFWSALSRKTCNVADIIIIDIPADHIVTRIKNKKYRYDENKLGIRRLEDNLFVYRPLVTIRPEVIPKIFQKMIMQEIEHQLKQSIKNFDDRKKVILYYDCKIVNMLKGIAGDSEKIYFIYDEVCLNASTGKEIKGIKELDYASCKEAKLILTMTESIAKRRSQFSDKILNIGNGADYVYKADNKEVNINKTIGFIGNFRDWIDFDLLENLIKLKSDYIFCFAGPIEDNVKSHFDRLLNLYNNTVYLGRFSKEKIKDIYNLIDIVIVPYKQNTHIKSTRPIKIVESIFNHTPVITIPMNGYDESMYIRFASNTEEFIEQIKWLENNKPSFNDKEFEEFLLENSWEAKADLLLNNLINIRKSV